MERPRITRGHLRAQITRTVNDITSELAKVDIDQEELEEKSMKLEELVPKVNELNGLIWNALLDGDASEDDRNKEFQEVEEYADKVRKIRLKVKKVLKSVEPGSTTQGQGQAAAAAVPVQDQMKSYKLPKLDLKHFDGEHKNWLGFWSQFKRIHEDPRLHATDKFQYLVQSTTEGSRARRLVEMFPMSEENYPKAVAHLKENCGNDKILLDYYVNEMVEMKDTMAKDASLEDILTRFVSSVHALESLGLKHKNESIYIYNLFEKMLPADILTAWCRSPSSGYDEGDSIPAGDKLDALIKFTQNEVRREQRLNLTREKTTPSSPPKEKKKEVNVKASKKVQFCEEDDIPTASALHIGAMKMCVFCSKNHPTQNCPKNFEMTLEEKKAAVMRSKCCFVCLRPGHMAKVCTYFVKCTGCSRRHYHIMCPDAEINRIKKVQEEPPVETKSVHINHARVRKGVVLLHTIRVKSVTGGGKRVLRMMLDNGSQRSYIRRSVAKLIQCEAVSSFMEKNIGFGGVTSKVERRIEYSVTLQDLDGLIKRQLVLADTEQITGNLPTVPEGPWIQELSERNIALSDFNTNEDNIDILIGMDLMKSVITGKSLMLKCGLIAKETVFGWTLGGELPGKSKGTVAKTVTSALLTESSCSQLWDLETLGIQDPAEVISRKEREVEVKNYFLQTVSRKEDGRYCVSLPWVGEVQQIPNNRSVAEKRLNSSTSKLKRDGKVEDYDKIIHSWEEEGFISEVVDEPKKESSSHYLPHRAVYKPESKTTPVRPVFDASCKVGRNPSLNECLEKGPNFIELIPNIMHRFRESKIGVISDIRKAFQMIEVDDEDKDFLRFLWWEDTTCKQIKVMRHNRVVFGVNCSPFLLGAVLEYHLTGVREEDKLIADKLMKSMYVDNCVTSVGSKEEYLTFKEEATRILAEAKMDLREWEFGPVEVSGVDRSIGERCGLETGSDWAPYDTYVLGMKWNKVSDTLRCDTVPAVPTGFTKRTLLSIMQQIFDPMGFLSPAMILPKLALQEAWAEKIDWDQDLPEQSTFKIKKWAEELEISERIRIPRSLDKNNLPSKRMQKIQWKFHPPSANWWSEWWERLVRTVKDLLKRMLGHGKLGYVQLETCLCEVEAVVNSRPLTFVSEDQVDLIPLSPVMFMQDLRETGCPEVKVLNAGDLRQRYKELSTLKDELRHRFRSEYLGQLVHKGKTNQARKFEVGEVVLVASDNKKRLQWLMARILELIPGKDGNVRIARVKTASGEIIRPLPYTINEGAIYTARFVFPRVVTKPAHFISLKKNIHQR